MVRHLKRLRHRKVLLCGLILLPLAEFLAVVGILVAPLAGEASGPQRVVATGLLRTAGVILGLGIGLIVAKYVSGWCYDPNPGTAWVSTGIGRATTGRGKEP